MAKLSLFDRRRRRVRTALRARGAVKPRLSVHRSSRHIYAQVIDDATGATLAHASSLDSALKGEKKPAANRETATRVGTLVAERAKGKGIERVVFDRGGYIYHGKVKALAEAARQGGLEF